MKKGTLLAVAALAALLAVSGGLAGEADWGEYKDSLGYSFKLPRTNVEALGWLKPSEADIQRGIVTSLGYEEGFFLQIYLPAVSGGLAFAQFGKQVYERLTRGDRSRKYCCGREINFHGEPAFAFDTEACFNQGDHQFAYWLPDRVSDTAESQDQRPRLPARVIYVSHRDRCYRIIYDPYSLNAKKTVDSFRFF